MAFKELSRSEADALLRGERVVRIGFEANGERYLVPLGFVWERGALYAMTTRGRKTRLGAASPKVSFQIDTSVTTGPFSWQSVTGEGTFEIVTGRRGARGDPLAAGVTLSPTCRAGCRPSTRRRRKRASSSSSASVLRR